MKRLAAAFLFLTILATNDATAACPTAADLKNGYVISWDTGMSSVVSSADGSLVHVEDTYPNKRKLKRDEYRGILILASTPPDGSSVSISYDKDPADTLPQQGESRSEFDVAITLTRSDGKTSVTKTRQLFELLEPVTIDIGTCRYQANTYRRIVLGDPPQAEHLVTYVPELLQAVELHATSYPGGKLRRIDRKAVSVSTLP